MSDTPRTDAVTWETIAGAFKCTGANGDLEGMGEYVKADFSRQLEREIATLRRKVEAAKDVAAAVVATLEWSGAQHDADCPEDDTCECARVRRLEAALTKWQEENK